MHTASRLARLVAILILSLGLSGVEPGSANASSTISILDTLGAAGPGTTFSALGSGGVSILDTQYVGPRFSLAHRAVITEIGAFVNTGHGAARVQIRRSVNGVPDPSTVLATFVLSDDGDPSVVSYESVAVHLKLRAGSYFALFAPPPSDEGSLLCCASSPFTYRADLVPTGFLNPTSGVSSASPGEYLATRILGRSHHAEGD